MFVLDVHANQSVLKHIWDPTLYFLWGQLHLEMHSLKVKRDGKVLEYTLLEKLGKGSYSQVFKCIRTCGDEKCIFVRTICFLMNCRQ